MNLKNKTWRTVESADYKKPSPLVWPKPISLENFRDNLDFVNNKLDYVQRHLTYYDIYNITATVGKSSDFDAAWASLLPNSALVINTTGINNYGRGDVLIKDTSGKEIHVPAQQGGLYFPSSLKKDGESYQLIYSYSSSTPVQGSTETVQLGENLDKPVDTITFEGLTDSSDSSASYIYGYEKAVTNGTITIELAKSKIPQYAEEDIPPIIKWFDINNEEVLWEYTINVGVKDGTETGIWTINDIPSLITKVVIK